METLIHLDCATKLQFTASPPDITSADCNVRRTYRYMCACVHECLFSRLTWMITGFTVWHKKGAAFKKQIDTWLSEVTCGSDYTRFWKRNKSKFLQKIVLNRMTFNSRNVRLQKCWRVCFACSWSLLQGLPQKWANLHERFGNYFQMPSLDLDSNLQPQNYKLIPLNTRSLPPRSSETYKFIKPAFSIS